MAEGELSRRVSGLEESFTQELTAMQKTLAGERLASKEKLKQVCRAVSLNYVRYLSYKQII